MARSLTKEQEQAILSRVVSYSSGNDIFPNGYAVAHKGRKGKARRLGPTPRRLVATRSSEEGGRTGAFIAGDDVSFGDIIAYAKYTPEFSQEFSNSKQRKFTEIQSPGDFIWWVFNKSDSFQKGRDSFVCPKGCHIQEMAYAERWSLMKVKFQDSTEIVYSRVPFNVFEILRGHAERNSTGTGVDGKEHSKVGIEFWNYVRIRGTRHGVQYPAYYLSGAPSANKGVGGRVEAEAGLANVGTQRTGKDGMPIDNAEKREALKAVPQKAFAFLDKELTAKDIEGIRKAADGLDNLDGTITKALVHGDVKKAKAISSNFNIKLLKSDRTSNSIKNELKKIERNPKLTEPYEPLIEMERYAVSQKLWPL